MCATSEFPPDFPNKLVAFLLWLIETKKSGKNRLRLFLSFVPLLLCYCPMRTLKNRTKTWKQQWRFCTKFEMPRANGIARVTLCLSLSLSVSVSASLLRKSSHVSRERHLKTEEQITNAQPTPEQRQTWPRGSTSSSGVRAALPMLHSGRRVAASSAIPLRVGKNSPSPASDRV